MQKVGGCDAQQTWDGIAESFDSTRRKPWGFCIEFLDSLEESFLVVDVGCGNGRHLIPCAQRVHMAIGVDISKNFLSLVSKRLTEENIRNVSLIHANASAMPFTQNSFDAVLFIASLHNIKGRKHRLAALHEIEEVLKPKGVGLISVWSRWQDSFRWFFFKQLFSGSSEFGDIDIYWKKDQLNVPRFYHLYSKREFLHDLKAVGFIIQDVLSLRISSEKYADNYVAVVKKR